MQVFLDNVMTGIPSLVLARHHNGHLESSVTQMSTPDIPKLATNPYLSVSEIERNATALLTFLKTNCAQDTTSFLFLKPMGGKVAGLWKIDPANDTRIDIMMRDRLVHNMAMLCVRASHTSSPQDAHRLTRHALALLDQAAAFGGLARNNVRVSLCEKVADQAFNIGLLFC